MRTLITSLRTVFHSVILLLVVVPTCFAFDVTTYVPQGELVGSFSGPNQWQGHITQNANGIRVILWESPDGLVVVGKLLDANARDLSALAQKKYQTNEVAISVLSKINVPTSAVEPGATESEVIETGVYSELEKLDSSSYTTILPSHVENEDAIEDELYVFYDYECPYCASAMQHLKTAGLNVKAHWLPVAILGNASASYGAGVLDGDVPIRHIANTSVVKYPRPSQTSLSAVAHNTTLLKAMQQRASTPTFVYRSKSGKVLTLSGFSEATSEALTNMLSEG